MRRFLLCLLVATAQGGPTPVAGDAHGSDSIKHPFISLDWLSIKATPDFETAAGSTSQSACGAGHITLSVPTDVQRNRGCPDGPHKTCSAFYSCCGGGSESADKKMSVQVAGVCAASSCLWHGPNVSVYLGDDACVEAVNKDKCTMNICTCVICDSEHANATTCKDNKASEFSLEGGSAHAAWDEGVALLYPLEETLRASGTCGANGGETLRGTWHTRPTIDIAPDEKLLRTRDFVRAVVDEISALMTVLQRGLLCSDKACADRSRAAVLPLFHSRPSRARRATAAAAPAGFFASAFFASAFSWLAAGPPEVAAAVAALAIIGTVMWRRNSKARRLGWSSLLGILLCLATVSGGLVTAAGSAALAVFSTALPDVTALPASPATTTPLPHPGCPHLQPLAAGTSSGRQPRATDSAALADLRHSLRVVRRRWHHLRRFYWKLHLHDRGATLLSTC